MMEAPKNVLAMQAGSLAGKGCVPIKPAQTLLHRRKFPGGHPAFAPLLCRPDSYCGSQPNKKSKQGHV
jgi:hypothetical protein